MKKALFTVSFLLTVVLLSGQTTVQTQAETALTDLSTYVKLDKAQEAAILDIFVKKYQGVEEIQALKATNQEQYLQKRSILSEMAYVELRKTLKENQQAGYSDWTKARGKQKTDLHKQLSKDGVSASDIRVRMVELD
jgi:hypothetical protein